MFGCMGMFLVWFRGRPRCLVTGVHLPSAILFSSFSRFLLHTHTLPTHISTSPVPPLFTIPIYLGLTIGWRAAQLSSASMWRVVALSSTNAVPYNPRARSRATSTSCVVLDHCVISTTTLTVLVSPPPLWTGHPCVRRSRFFCPLK